jgi:hypothetical protein
MKMKKEFYMRANNFFWTFRWTYGANSFVCFSNPKVFINVIYSIEELEALIAQGVAKLHDISIPKRVLHAAYSEKDMQSFAAMAA